MPSTVLKSGLALLITAMATSANACIVSVPLEIEDVRHADAVFSGRLLRYELVSPGRPDSLDEYGLLTVRVDDVLKGNVSGDVQLYWWNSTFGVPKTMESAEALLIAAIDADREGLPLRGPSGTVFPTRRPDLLQILQAPCSGAFIFPYSEENADNIRNILRGSPAEPIDYQMRERVDEAQGTVPGNILVDRVGARERVDEAQGTVPFTVGFATLTLVSVATGFFWYRRRKRLQSAADGIV